MIVGCNVVTIDREERNRDWAVVSSDTQQISAARKGGPQQIDDCNVVLLDKVERSRYRL